MILDCDELFNAEYLHHDRMVFNKALCNQGILLCKYVLQYTYKEPNAFIFLEEFLIYIYFLLEFVHNIDKLFQFDFSSKFFIHFYIILNMYLHEHKMINIHVHLHKYEIYIILIHKYLSEHSSFSKQLSLQNHHDYAPNLNKVYHKKYIFSYTFFLNIDVFNAHQKGSFNISSHSNYINFDKYVYFNIYAGQHVP